MNQFNCIVEPYEALDTSFLLKLFGVNQSAILMSMCHGILERSERERLEITPVSYTNLRAHET